MSKKQTSTQKRTGVKCQECGSPNLVHDYDTGETVCGGCGLVLYEQMMDKGPEWRAFTQEEKTSRSRVGVPTSYSVHDKGLSTAISQVDRDAFGRKLPLSTRLQMWRLREAIVNLHKIDPEVRAIVASGFSNDPVMSEYKKYGFRGVVMKPCKIEELSNALHTVLAK